MPWITQAVHDYGASNTGFGIIIDNDSIEYVWPVSVDTPPFTGEERVEAYLRASGSKADSLTDDDLKMIALDGTTTEMLVSPWEEINGTTEEALEEISKRLDELEDKSPNEYASPLSRRVQAAIADNPDAVPGEEDLNADVTPDDMLHILALSLGEIDPEGPNGFILRALEGEPLPGDEKLFPVFDDSRDVSIDQKHVGES